MNGRMFRGICGSVGRGCNVRNGAIVMAHEGPLIVGLVDAHVAPVPPGAVLQAVPRGRGTSTTFFRAVFMVREARALGVVLVFVVQRETRSHGEMSTEAVSRSVGSAEEDIGLGINLVFLRDLYPPRADAYRRSDTVPIEIP